MDGWMVCINNVTLWYVIRIRENPKKERKKQEENLERKK